MGVEVTAYLGPYVEYTVSVGKGKRNACPEPASCPEPQEGFCPRCGIRAQDRLREFEVEDPSIDVIDDYDEALVTMDSYGRPKVAGGRRTYTVLPNQRREGAYERQDRWDAKRGEEACVDVDPDVVRAERTWFEQAFAPEIEDLRRRCGPDHVKVCWGLVIYCC